MHLNHPKPTLPPLHFHGKIVFHETSLWCQKSGGPLIAYQYICIYNI